MGEMAAGSDICRLNEIDGSDEFRAKRMLNLDFFLYNFIFFGIMERARPTCI